MCIDAEENRRIGELLAGAANAATGPIAVLLPLGAVSMLDSEGGRFWDPDADRACYDAIKANLRPGMHLVELPYNINDAEFSAAAATTLAAMLEHRSA